MTVAKAAIAASLSPSTNTATMPSGTATTVAGRAEPARPAMPGSAPRKAIAASIRPLQAGQLAALEVRGLDPALLVKLGGGASGRLVDGDAIALPFFDQGTMVACKHRTLGRSKNFTQEAGGRQIFWNQDCLRDETLASEPLIITEGELDALSAIQAGFPRTVSVPGGAPMVSNDPVDGKRYAFLDEAWPLLRDVKEIILAVDADTPGANLLHDLALRLGRHRCKWLAYPFDAKDLNGVLKIGGERSVQETIRRAQWLKVEGVYRLSELPPVAPQASLSTGVAGLDPHYRIRKGDFCVITGLPGHGKTSLVNEIACNMARHQGWGVVFASFEQTPQLDHRRALRSYHAGKREAAMDGLERYEADQWIDRHFSFVVAGEDDETTLHWVLEKIAAATIRTGASLVVIDPWNEMDHHDRPRDMTTTEYVGFAIRQFRRFARKHGVHLIVVAHPAKMHRGKDGTYPVPGLYDISDSAHWSNKADVGLVVHRADLLADPETQIRVVKSRYHSAIGTPGEVRAVWDEGLGRFQSTRDGITK